MPKRKKYPKLPNGYGSIKYLGKGRRNPYAVHPPTTEFTLDGVPITPKALCYVDDWMKGFAVLTAYKAGTYTPGMEKCLMAAMDPDSTDIVQKILADYSLIRGAEPAQNGKTFKQVYEEYRDYKFNRDKSKVYSPSTKNGERIAFNNCRTLHDKPFRLLRHDDLQNVLDCCPLGHSSLKQIVNLLKQMYAYAEIYDLSDRDYSAHIKINQPNNEKHGEAFTDADLAKLWQHKDEPTAEMLLIMCYSGFRIQAYKTLAVNIKSGFFQGGLKTAAGKDRIVPIHSAILPLVKKRLRRDGSILAMTANNFRYHMRSTLAALDIEKHTPHDCRHTFSALCERYGVNENDRRRMLGHSFVSDITNGTYGHRSIEDLRHEIEKIKACY